LTDNIDGPQGDYSKAIGGLQLPSGLITPAKRSSRTLRRRNALVANSFVLRGKRVLDVGCAEGLQSLYLSASADEVWGVDHRASEIDIARATAKALGAQNVRFECGDVRDPELFKKIGVFDLVIAWGFLHRISDVFALFYSRTHRASHFLGVEDADRSDVVGIEHSFSPSGSARIRSDEYRSEGRWERYHTCFRRR
jgi:SAM-dependent methyltransferase